MSSNAIFAIGRTCSVTFVLAAMVSTAAAQNVPQSVEAISLDATAMSQSPDIQLPDPNAIRILLTPELETTLVAQTVGRIAKLNASLGASVKKGQTLVALACGEAQARVQMARAEYSSARQTLVAKKKLQALDAAGDVEVSLAQSDVNRNHAAIVLAQEQLKHCTIKAPFSGRVVKLRVKPHQGVNVGMPLLEMISDGALKVRLNVPSRLLPQLRLGGVFKVFIDETSRQYDAKITAINARIDAVAQTIELEAKIDGKPPELLAGMSGTADFANIE